MRAMVKTISKVGNSACLIFDSTLRKRTGLKAGDKVYVTVHESGAIVITPITSVVDENEARARGDQLVRAKSELFRRLA
jgi:antitoxin component of MazEF toxin-antitoxin module